MQKPKTLAAPATTRVNLDHHPWQPALQILGCFLLYMNAWAMPNSFGVFQSYHAESLMPEKSESQIAWIGSLQAFLLLFVTVLAGPAVDAGHLRLVLVLGSGSMTVGLMLTSISRKYYQLMLAQGLCVGVGTGCVFLPTVVIAQQWVAPQHSTVVLGVVAAGSSLGGIIYPILFNAILPSAGFGWAVRALGVLTFATNAFATVVLKYRNALPSQRRHLVDLSMWKSWYFPVLCAALWCAMAALYIPIVFLQSFYATLRPESGHEAGPHYLENWLLPILMAGSIPGRLIPGLIAKRVGTVNTIIFALLISSVLAFCWIALDHGGTASIIIFALLYGFSSGGVVSLVPPVVIATAPNERNLGTRMGMALGVGGFGLLVGNPVAGAILTYSSSFLGVQVLSGAILMTSLTFLLIVKLLTQSSETRPGTRLCTLNVLWSVA